MAAAVMALGLASCSDELNIHSIDPQSSTTYTEDGLLAKMYEMLGQTGQKGPAGDGDLGGQVDEGESGFYRTTFNMEELPTDEILWAWRTDPDIPQLEDISWNSSSQRTFWGYTRLTYDITQYNFYLSQVPDDEAHKAPRAEVRFLRALHYWYLLDLFHKSPFKTTFDISTLPTEKSGPEMYQWLDEELTSLEEDLPDVGAYDNATNFGRADKGAAYLLHARLCLNAPVYAPNVSATEAYQKALQYCNLIENSGAYQLSSTPLNGHSGYAQLFMADNDENTNAMKEIILPIRQDGLKTRSYSGAMYAVNSFRKAGMPDMGTTNGWSCNFARAALVKKFFPTLSDCPLSTEEAPEGATEEDIKALDEQDGSSTAQIIQKAGDDRALFYAGRGGGVKKRQCTTGISSWNDGISVVKWDNHRADGQQVHAPGTDCPDVDIPLLRYAEVFMIKAEANFRLGNRSEALRNLNILRNRAGATPLTDADLSLETILDEWCREFYAEGRRRSDLVRFGVFAGNSRALNGKMYLWDWKGGVADGTIVDSHYNAYPIPANDITNNTNLHQNEGY